MLLSVPTAGISTMASARPASSKEKEHRALTVRILARSGFPRGRIRPVVVSRRAGLLAQAGPGLGVCGWQGIDGFKPAIIYIVSLYVESHVPHGIQLMRPAAELPPGSAMR
jgi:hypothetical protein